MEREILFRAQLLDNKEWIEGYYYMDFKNDPEAFLLSKNDGIVYPVKPDTVFQFTGLTDKKGKRIFEGDIVNSDYGYGHPACLVEFKSIIYSEVECLISDDIEVIGNIYDSPELLK